MADAEALARPHLKGEQAFLAGGGEMGALMRAHDWSSSPLGVPEEWPPALKTAVSLMLGSAAPVYVAWGPDLISLYNDGYLPIVGTKHPGLGLPFTTLWAEVWEHFEPLVAKTLAGEAQHFVDLPIALAGRPGVPTGWFTFSYTPLRDEAGDIIGLYCVATETTDRVLAQRAQTFRLALEERLRELDSADAVMTAAVTTLGEHLGASRVGYGRVLADDATVRLTNCYTDGVEPLLGDFPLDGFGPESIARQRRGEVEVCADVAADPQPNDAVWAGISTRAFVSVPLVRDGRFCASLYVNSREPRAWSADKVALIEEVAARTWAVVERSAAEAREREKSARLELALTAGRLAEVTFDVVGGDVSHSAAFAELLGHPPHKTISLTEFRAQYHPDDRDRVIAERARILASDEDFYEIDKRIVRPDDEVRWVYGRGRVARDAEGRALTVTAVYLDETERKRAELALRESEARQAFLLSLSDLLRSLSTPGEITSAAAERLGEHFGLSRVFYAEYFGSLMRVERDYTRGVGSIVGEHNLVSFGPELLRAYHECAVVKVDDVETDERLSEEARAGLRARQVGAFLDVVLFENEEWVSLLAFQSATPRTWTAMEESLFRDVAERVRSAIERARSEEQLRQFNETLEAQVAERTAERDRAWSNARDLLLVVSTDGVFRTVNPAWQTILGWRDDELVGRSYLEFIYPDDHPSSQSALATASREGLPTYENRYRHKDGSYRTISWVAAPESDLIYASGRDVTAEKEREAELAQAQEALRQSQKMEAMGSLTGGVSHDFNNLLTPIISSLDLLQRKGIGGERERRLIDGALQSAERAKTLVHRLLAFARRQPLQPRPVDVAALVAGMADLVASTSGPRTKVEVDVANDLPAAVADPNQLEMAILNLSVNARDAMPDGGRLTIAVRTSDVGPGSRSGLAPGRYVGLSVSDTGCGMDAEIAKRAVEPFFSTKGVGRGTGLGLSMVHGLAAQLGGALTIDSKPGLGTTIEVWLPASDASVVEPQAAIDEMPRPSAGTVLLVDDEELVRASTADMLVDLGHAVVEAASAEDALRLIDGGLHFDVLVTDHLMPGLTGDQLAREMRSRRPGLPVLLVSGYAEVEGMAPDLPRLVKPFRQSDLAAKLGEMDGVSIS